MSSSHSTQTIIPESATAPPPLPDDVRAQLQALGVSPDGEDVLHIEADLDARGYWSERHLIATPQRLLVFSVAGDKNNNHKLRPDQRLLKRLSKTNAQADTRPAQLELDVPVSAIIEAETKSLSGASALELRVRQTRNGAPQNGNGAAPPETATASKTADSKPAREQVVEILRSSNSRAKELLLASRQITHLRQHGALQKDMDTSEYERRVCAKCGRALRPDSDVCPACFNKWQVLQRLLVYLMEYKWLVLGNGLLSIVGVGLGFIPALALSQLVDHVLPSPQLLKTGFTPTAVNYSELQMWVTLIVLSSIAAMICNIVRGRWVAKVGSSVLHDIRTQLYDHLQKLSLAFYDKRETGAVMSRVQNDVQMLQNFLLNTPEDFVISLLTVTGVIVIMLTRSPSLTLFVLLPIPFVMFATTRYWRGLMKLWRRVWAQNSSLSARLADTLGGVRVVRAFAQEEKEVSRYSGKSGEYRDAMIRVEQKAASFYPVLGFVIGLGAPITWLIGGKQVLDGTLTLGGLTMFTVLLQSLYQPIGVLTRMINILTRAMTAAERVFEIMDTPPDIRDARNSVAMPLVKGDVEFRNVTFGYDKHRPVLKDITLEVKAGEMIGLVGHSGAGKSTLINLLMRFYDVNDGAIVVDGVDLRDITREDLRKQIGVVLQEPYLFHGTIAENIAYAEPDATPAEIMAAAKAAYAHNFITSFPDGYDALVGERGLRLSGGERQRISIARAILHNPRILILDEATASVDTETEGQIQKALKNLVQGRTTFAIAHRLSTLRDADRLVVIDDGKIVETGTHDELMKKRGAFYRLVQAQQSMNEVLAIGG
jgi:ATP-binding cassette subfamily B protein